MPRDICNISKRNILKQVISNAKVSGPSWVLQNILCRVAMSKSISYKPLQNELMAT